MEKRRNGTEKRRGMTRTMMRSRSSFDNPIPRIRKLNSHLSTLSLKAPWNCVAIRHQKPNRPRGFSPGGAAIPIVAVSEEETGFSAISSGSVLIAAEARKKRLARGLRQWQGYVMLNKNAPEWRNWQTRRTQNPVAARPCGFNSLLRHHRRQPTIRLRASVILERPITCGRGAWFAFA